MGVQELPDGEPNPLQHPTIGSYAKAYMDWALDKRLLAIEERLAAIEAKAKGAKP